MTADFSSILGKQRSDIEEPKPLPSGEYRALIFKPGKLDESRGEAKTPYVRFEYRLLEAMESVDPDLLAVAGGLKKKDGEPKTIGQHDFWLTEDAMYILRNFVDSVLGADNWDKLIDALPELVNQEVIITLGVESFSRKDGTQGEKVVVRRAVGTYNS